MVLGLVSTDPPLGWSAFQGLPPPSPGVSRLEGVIEGAEAGFDPRVLEGIPDQHDGVEIRKIAGICRAPASGSHRSREFLWPTRCTSFKSSRYA